MKDNDNIRCLLDTDCLKAWRCDSISAVLCLYREYPEAKWKHYSAYEGYILVIFQWSNSQ